VGKASIIVRLMKNDITEILIGDKGGAERTRGCNPLFPDHSIQPLVPSVVPSMILPSISAA